LSGSSNSSGSGSGSNSSATGSGGTGTGSSSSGGSGSGSGSGSDACRGFLSCETCDKSKGCGWCNVKGVCVQGDQLGPLETPCQVWSFGACGGPRCGTLGKCGDCLADTQCGWCEGRCSCHERKVGDTSGPNFGVCPKGWFVGGKSGALTCPVAATSNCKGST
jgi:hypothetical protein